MTPKVSILIPLYNSEKYIGATIESCLDQVWPNIEVIVIDDGSTDGSLSVARTYESDKVKVLSQENKGACTTRNRLLKLSTGEYIQYLDADDLLSKNKISEQIKLLKKDMGLIASCSWSHFINEPNDIPPVKDKVFKTYNNPVDFFSDSWNGGGMMSTACWLVPRRIAEEAGPWDETLISNQNDDGEYFSRIIVKAKKIIFTDKSHVYYRLPGESNVSQQRSFVAAECLLQSYIKYELNIPSNLKNKEINNGLCLNFLSFTYRFYKIYPDLAKISLNKARTYENINYNKIGGSFMRVLTFLLGFEKALMIRHHINTMRKGLVKKN